jgi:tRNA1Val (adenine37-N6)-methyltransferase
MSFTFKQFHINQDRCAMKVTTDACLFGAWNASLNEVTTAKNILDIGAGTGLLSLILAQKTKANIEAVEIDETAFQQCKENFAASPWANSLHVHHSPIQDFQPDSKFQFIITNPPFFKADLQSPDDKRNLALHSSALDFTTLLNSINRLLDVAGHFSVLLPFHRQVEFVALAAAQSFHLHQLVQVKQTPKHAEFRSMLLFGRTKEEMKQEEITIKNGENEYTDAFVDLLKDYYLYL